MLKMTCPNCRHWIYSHLLGEMKIVYCKHCKTDVTVGDVYVSSRGYTMFRGDLLSSLFRYEKLLLEAEKEVSTIQSKAGDTHIEGINSISSVIRSLGELLDGARSNFRIQLPYTDVKYRIGDALHNGRLVNVSVVGACIEPKNKKILPRRNDKIHMDFSLPEMDKAFSINGIVTWIKQGAEKRGFDTGVGVEFEALNEVTRALIWEFIAGRDAKDGFSSVIHE